jgi:2-hydroxy-3-keto-5-methylthiopentenyl-1-phosphate phosphatase
MGFIILSDFDGTIVNIDTAEYALRKFAQGDWQAVEDLFERGKITFEECLRRQFAMIRVSERVLLNELSHVTSFRPSFRQLVEYCEGHQMPFIIVSGGLDFLIHHFLSLEGLIERVEIYAPKSECTTGGIEVTFPKLLDGSSINFKDDLVKHHRKRGERVVYVGNGIGDYPAVCAADLSFVIKDSALAQLCRNTKLPYNEIEDFQEVIEGVKKLISSGTKTQGMRPAN